MVPLSHFSAYFFSDDDTHRANKASETADRIYQCNAARGGGAGEEAGREGPEGGRGRVYPIAQMVRATAERTGLPR